MDRQSVMIVTTQVAVLGMSGLPRKTLSRQARIL